MFDHIHHFQQLSSCVGSNSCGVYFNTAPSDTAGLWFGATHLQNYEATRSQSIAAGKVWLNDSEGTTEKYVMTGSDQGMFTSGASINAFWADTTKMDNLRAADITATSVAGSLETIAPNNSGQNVRGGHSIHMRSDEMYYSSKVTFIRQDKDGAVLSSSAADVAKTGYWGPTDTGSWKN